MAGEWGRLVVATHVADAVTAALRAWMPSMVAYVLRQVGRDPQAIPAPPEQHYHRMVSAQQLADNADQLPAVAVWPDDVALERRRNRYDAAMWPVTVEVLSRAGDYDQTAADSEVYRAAVAMSLAQELRLGGLAEHGYLRGYATRPLGKEVERTLLGGAVFAEYAIRDVLTEDAGPDVPPADPFAEPAAPGGAPVTTISQQIERST